MRITHAPAGVQNDHRRDGCHTVGAGKLTAEFVEEIQAHNFRLSLKIFFNPIHDGFRYKASRSSVREEVNDHGLPAFDHRVELMPGLELRRARSEKEEPDPNQK